MNDGYFKWWINGLGEAYGFMFKLKSNNKAFIVKTLVNVQGLDDSQSIEWLIDAENLEAAIETFKGLELKGTSISWKKGDVSDD